LDFDGRAIVGLSTGRPTKVNIGKAEEANHPGWRGVFGLP
jgi:hypothetical protein